MILIQKEFKSIYLILGSKDNFNGNIQPFYSFINEFLSKWQQSIFKPLIAFQSSASPAGAPIKSIFVRKGHAIHHFYELFELISIM